MRQPIEDDANRPAWEDTEPAPDGEAPHPPVTETEEAVKEAEEESVKDLAEQAYERAMTPPPVIDEEDR